MMRSRLSLGQTKGMIRHLVTLSPCHLVIFLLLACGGCAKKKSTDQLLEELKSSKGADRIQAVRLLQDRRGDAAKIVPAMIESLKDKQVDVRLSAAIGLGYFGEQAKDAIPALEQAAKSDRDVRVREQARVALSSIDPTRFSAPQK
jgi:HEAT repeat protein